TPADGGTDGVAGEPTGSGPSEGRGGQSGGSPAPYHDPERRAARRSVQTTMVKDHDDDVNVTTLDMNRIVTLIGLVVLAVMVLPPTEGPTVLQANPPVPDPQRVGAVRVEVRPPRITIPSGERRADRFRRRWSRTMTTTST